MSWWTNRSFPSSHHLPDLEEEQEEGHCLSEDTLDGISTDSLDRTPPPLNKVVEAMSFRGYDDLGKDIFCEQASMPLKDRLMNVENSVRSSSISRSSQPCWKIEWPLSVSTSPVPRSSTVSVQTEYHTRKKMTANRQRPIRPTPLVKGKSESYRFSFIQKLRPSASPSSSTCCEAPSSRSLSSSSSTMRSDKSSTSWVLKLVLQQQLFANDVRRQHLLHARRLAAAASEAKTAKPTSSATTPPTPSVKATSTPTPQKRPQRRFKPRQQPKKPENAVCDLPPDLQKLESRLRQLQLQHQCDVRLAEKVDRELTHQLKLEKDL